MTNDEKNIEIAKAVQDFSENKKKIADLVDTFDLFLRLKIDISNTIRPLRITAPNAPMKLNFMASGLEEMRDFESDPRQIAADLLELLKEQQQLRAILRTHDLEIE